MELVVNSDPKVRNLAFYLAEEEWLASRFPGRDFFFAWQVEPSVIVGRNQLIDKEINYQFCVDNGIKVYRRKSGGGAVLADMNNIMLSYVTTSSAITTTFSAFTGMVAKSLRKLGLDASDNSRNDILIGSRKVSGNCYFHSGGRSIVHGTMLYDCDTELMLKALTPSTAKLESHGVASVKSRVTTVKEHLPSLSLEDFKRHLLETIPDGPTMTLTPADIAEIEEIEQTYYRPEWLKGKDPKGTVKVSERIPGVGEISVHISLNQNAITKFELTGDFLETADAEKAIAERLVGAEFSPEAVGAKLKEVTVEELIPGLAAEKLLSMIF